MLPAKFRFICPSGEDFQKSTKQKQELPEGLYTWLALAILVSGWLISKNLLCNHFAK
jgi:hypothetical protein